MAAPALRMAQPVYVLRRAHRSDFTMSRDEWRALASRPTDPPRSGLGQQQATEAGQFFAALGDASIGHVLASPYLRCIQTAHPIAAAVGTTVKVDVGFGEILPGDDALHRKFFTPALSRGQMCARPYLGPGA